MANAFDQFDQPAEQSNPFDKFDSGGSVATAAPPTPAPASYSGPPEADPNQSAPEDSYYALPQATRDKYDADANKFMDWAQKPLASAQQLRPILENPASPLGQAMLVSRASNYLFPNKVSAAAVGTGEGVEDAVAGFSSPMNLGMLAVAPEGKLAQVGVGALFEAQAIRAFPQMWQQYQNEDDPQKKAQLLTSMAIGLGLPAMAPFHAGMERSEPSPQSQDLPQSRPMPDAAQPESPSNPPSSETVSSQASQPSTPVPASLQPDLARVQPGDVPQVTQDPLAPQIGNEISTEDITAALKQRGFEDWQIAQILKDKFGREASAPEVATVSPDTSAESTPTEGQDSTPTSAESSPASTSIPQPEPTETTGTRQGVNGEDPFMSRIANRFSEERSKQGEIGEIAPGEGVSTRELVDRGLKMSPEEINQHVSDLMNDTGGDPVDQASAVRGEEARLSQRSLELSRIAERQPNSVEAKLSADNAFKDLTDFHNGPVAKLKNRWHAQGMAMQGSIPVDLSTFNGLREAWLNDTGKAPPPEIEPTLRRAANRVSETVSEEGQSMNRLGDAIEKESARRGAKSAEDVRNSIIERMKDQPCRI